MPTKVSWNCTGVSACEASGISILKYAAVIPPCGREARSVEESAWGVPSSMPTGLTHSAREAEAGKRSVIARNSVRKRAERDIVVRTVVLGDH